MGASTSVWNCGCPQILVDCGPVMTAGQAPEAHCRYEYSLWQFGRALRRFLLTVQSADLQPDVTLTWPFTLPPPAASTKKQPGSCRAARAALKDYGCSPADPLEHSSLRNAHVSKAMRSSSPN